MRQWQKRREQRRGANATRRAGAGTSARGALRYEWLLAARFADAVQQCKHGGDGAITRRSTHRRASSRVLQFVVWLVRSNAIVVISVAGRSTIDFEKARLRAVQEALNQQRLQQEQLVQQHQQQQQQESNCLQQQQLELQGSENAGSSSCNDSSYIKRSSNNGGDCSDSNGGMNSLMQLSLLWYTIMCFFSPVLFLMKIVFCGFLMNCGPTWMLVTKRHPSLSEARTQARRTIWYVRFYDFSPVIRILRFVGIIGVCTYCDPCCGQIGCIGESATACYRCAKAYQYPATTATTTTTTTAAAAATTTTTTTTTTASARTAARS